MPTTAQKRFVLLDRDGVLNEAVRDGYVTGVEMLRLLPGAAEAIARLNRNGFEAIVVSNQQCVGKGILSQEGLAAITEALGDAIEEVAGGVVADFLYCTHLSSDGCLCRKPKPGLLLEAQRRYGFDLATTYFVGDSFSDLLTAAAAGCPSIFVLSGLDAQRYTAGEPFPHAPAHIARDLSEAVDWILA